MKIFLLLVAILIISGCASVMGSRDPVTCEGWDQDLECGPTANCAALLYNRASAAMDESERLARRHLYIAASSGYREASCMLKHARVKLSAAQLSNFQDWKIANTFGLNDRIEEAIVMCDRLTRTYEWKR